MISCLQNKRKTRNRQRKRGVARGSVSVPEEEDFGEIRLNSEGEELDDEDEE